MARRMNAGSRQQALPRTDVPVDGRPATLEELTNLKQYRGLPQHVSGAGFGVDQVYLQGPIKPDMRKDGTFPKPENVGKYYFMWGDYWLCFEEAQTSTKDKASFKKKLDWRQIKPFPQFKKWKDQIGDWSDDDRELADAPQRTRQQAPPQDEQEEEPIQLYTPKRRILGTRNVNSYPTAPGAPKKDRRGTKVAFDSEDDDDEEIEVAQPPRKRKLAQTQEYLTEDDSQRLVPACGMGGFKKQKLADNPYEEPIETQFDDVRS